MVLINGRKHACVSCIRGHRASSCSHTGRPLQAVRSKGRPSSQCDTCKEKRVKGGFHGKCECGRSSSIESSSQHSDASMTMTAEGSNQWRKEKRGKHNLEELMNPCQCKVTGICTCCKSDSGNAKENDIVQDQICDASCCSVESCCSVDTPAEECVKVGSNSCCGGGVKPKSTQMPLPTIIESHMSLDEAYKRSDCQCGATCNCPQCSQHGDTATSDLDDCPGLCLNCSACLSGLTRPSGIKAVDDWMEKDRSTNGERSSRGSALTALASAATKRPEKSNSPNNLALVAPPPLPPFPQAAKFFNSHFLDEERRRYFSQQMQQSHDNEAGVLVQERPEKMMYGQRMQGESDEEWQIRHGYYHLTPSAVNIFDAAREFKESRKAQEEEEEKEMQIEPYYSPMKAAAPSMESGQMQDLDELRRRALSARKKTSAVKT